MAIVLPNAVRKWLPESVTDSLRRFFWNIPNLNRTLDTGIELAIQSPSDWVIFNEVFVDHEYDEAIVSALDSHRSNEPLQLLDVGANVGYFALRAAHLCLSRRIDFRLTAVEGSPKSFSRLRKRLYSQSQLGESIRLVNGLIGLREGHGRIQERGTHFTYSALDSSETGTVVPYFDLSSLLEGVAQIDLLKCDIEGSEELFLRNYPDVLAATRNLVIEIHARCCDSDRCLALLSSSGLVRQQVLSANAANDTALHLCSR